MRVADKIWQTAALGLFSGTKISLEARPVDENAEWIVVLGSTGAVGQYAVQVFDLLKIASNTTDRTYLACETGWLQSPRFLFTTQQRSRLSPS